MARVAVRVHPRAKRSAVAGRFGEAWKIDLAAPPVDGKANEECVRFFAELAEVPKSRVRIVTGATGRNKVVEVEGVEQAWLDALLGARAKGPELEIRDGTQSPSPKANGRR